MDFQCSIVNKRIKSAALHLLWVDWAMVGKFPSKKKKKRDLYKILKVNIKQIHITLHCCDLSQKQKCKCSVH